MGRRILPSASGLPDDWDKEIELRLGYLEAQDEAREPKIIIKVLKREFPKLSRDVISAEILVRWIDWLDRQDGPRGDSYRAGLAAGQVAVLKSLKAKGVELEPMNLNRYSKTHRTTRTESPAIEGVRLVENEESIDDEIRAAAGGLESIIGDKSASATPNVTASVSQQSMHETLVGNVLHGPVASTSFSPISYNSPGSISGTRQGSHDARLTPHLGNSESKGSTIPPKTHTKIGSTTPVSAYFPHSSKNTPSSSSPNTPGSISQQHRSHSIAPGQSPRRSKSANESSPGSMITRSATVASATETLVRTRSGLGISKPVSTQGLRERRQMGELNVGIVPPSRSIQALPAITGQENYRQPHTPSGNSTGSIGLGARIMAKWNRT